MSLIESIRSYSVPRGSAALWWLGQSGFIFKTHAGTTAGVDLYLTDSVAGMNSPLNLSRQVPVPIEPEELRVDVFACTHNHQDHTDPETIRRLRSNEIARFVGPHPSCDVFRRFGIEESRIVPAWPDCDIGFRDIRIRGTFALPTDDTDLNHVGFVFEFESGPKVYLTGDTDFSELLFSAAKHSPDLAITVINGGFNNLSHWEAAELMGKVKPKAAIPSHFDMFPDNSVDPRQFEAALKLKAPGVRYIGLRHGEPLLVER